MSAKVIIYTMTICPYCIAAKKMLKKKGVAFEEVNLDHHPERWDECERRSGRKHRRTARAEMSKNVKAAEVTLTPFLTYAT